MLKDLIAALILISIAGAYYLLAGDINASALADELGPTGLPVVYATVLATLGSALAVKAFVARRLALRQPKARRAHGPEDREASEGRELLGAAPLLGIGVGYVAAVTLLGYVLSLAALIFLVAAYEGERPGWRLGSIAAAGALGFWLLFDRILGVEMPPGFWPSLWGA